MFYNEELDSRITSIISKWGTTRNQKFGGTCHLINGNMMCGVYNDYLILRLSEERANKALEQSSVKSFDTTGRPMKGWVMVEEKGFKGSALDTWLDQAHEFAASLPPK